MEETKFEHKYEEYGIKIARAIWDCFSEHSLHHIDKSELSDEENMRHYLHALGNLAPVHLFNTLLTGNEKDEADALEWNHIANDLCFLFGEMEGRERIKDELIKKP